MTRTTILRPIATILVVGAAAVAALAGAGTASAAGAGTFDFITVGRCDQTLQGTLIVTGPRLAIYGLSTVPDRVDIWYRLVDLAGNGQTDWIFKGSTNASSTTATTVGATQITRPAWSTSSRIQFFVQYFSKGVYTRYYQSTATLYDTYSFGGPYFQKTYTGRATACFG